MSEDSISRLARELDHTVVRSFIRYEMWQFLLDVGWTTDPEPPPPRRGTVAAVAADDGEVSATARFLPESVQMQGGNANPPTADTPSDTQARAQRLREKLGVGARRPSDPVSDG